MADVERYTVNCHVCRRAKVPRDKTPGLLRPLPVPDRPWMHLSMDFCSFPVDKHGYDTVFVIIDRLSKNSFSMPCHKTVDSEALAWLFVSGPFRHHSAPVSIVSNRGPQFVSAFWKAFYKILGITMSLSTADHPQTDGQTEVMNQYLVQRLRPYVDYYQDNWSEMLPAMDFAQATLHHSSIGMTPALLVNGYEPRTSFD